MSRNKFAIINGILLVLVLVLGFKLYSIIQEPIVFNSLKEQRYAKVIERLENIRDAQQAFKGEYGTYTDNMAVLVGFVDTGHVTIKLRKDSSFLSYNKVYQQDMMKDTLIVRVIGRKKVIGEVFPEGFEAASLARVPFNETAQFTMGKGVIEKNKVQVPVFEAKVGDTLIFADVYERFKPYIKDRNHALQIGSLVEPTLSGNWK
jgi:hypothetical protein